MDYKKINTYLGWLIFIIATTVYFITLEDSVSLWDCGEYVTAAYKLEVGHPPGAPLFMVLGRLSSFFADPENVAVWINRLSALSSSATILFMFWSITLLVKKMILRTKDALETGDKIAIFGSAVVGSLAYTFSDSFWFSAVEGEVYAMSSLFTAIIFWAALKWDEEMIRVQQGKLVPKNVSPDRWMLLIMFMLGLAVGVHLLGILVVPAIAYVVYFRYNGISSRFFQIYIGVAIFSVVVGIFKMGNGFGDAVIEIVKQGVVLGILYGLFLWSKTQKIIEFLLVGLMSIVLLSFIQDGVITGSISFASFLEITMVNSIGLPFYSGTVLFFLILIGLFVYMLRRSRKSGNRAIYSAVMGLLLLLIGYGSFAVIVIRSNANTPLDENDPENLVTLHSYLKREQYGSAPLAYGQFWNSRESGGKFMDVGGGQKQWNAGADRTNWDDQAPIHLRRFVVKQGEDVIRAFQSEASAKDFAKKNKGLTIEETYFVSNEDSREGAIPTYSQNTLFPRMYWSADPSRTASYKDWSGYNRNSDATTEIGKDGERIPTMGENLTFFFRYQVNWMYWRYFLWNFSGRQNDIQGSRGAAMRGNWLSGYSVVDNARLGDQSAAPYYTKENKANNNFFLLPLVLGLIGLFFHAYRSPKQAFVLFLAFLFTGLAIVVYLNQKPLEPRERDYAYAGSFYFFAMWIGMGVFGLYETFKNISKETLKRLGYAAGGGLFIFFLFDMGSPVGMPATIGWFIVLLLIGVLMGIMYGLKKVTQKNTHGAVVAGVLALAVPILMGMEGWDDHDRSNKTSAHDLAYNYLVSCQPNGIIFTNGDNDTFPLWYMQEVEEKFTDRRVCNLSLMQTDWYTNQMKMKAYESEPLPIKFTEDQILMNYGGTDQVFFKRLIDLIGEDMKDEKIIKRMLKLRIKQNPDMAMQKTQGLINAIPQILAGAQGSTPQMDKQIRQYIAIANKPLKGDTTNFIYEKLVIGMRIFTDAQSGTIQLDQSKVSLINKHVFKFEDGWDITNLPEAMAFVRDDENMMPLEAGGDLYRFFPSSGFAMDVNEKNIVKSGLVSKQQVKDCAKNIKFRFRYSTERNPGNERYTVEGIPVSRAQSLSKSYLKKEQVMMLDIIANNDWERPLYFSSPSGSEVASAILHGYSGDFSDGYIKQNGMAFELTPLKGTPGINRERMYDNLMNKYHYGNMKNPDVLTDYYTRRHTSQYRSHFLRLASSYLREVEMAERVAQQNPNQTSTDILSAEKQKEYKQKAIKLLKKSLEVMPAEIVIDHSEPTQTGEQYLVNGKARRGFTDGVLHDYVDVFYMAGDKEAARKLAKTLADQYESIFEYFEKSDARITGETDNAKDLYAALESYFIVYGAVSSEDSGSALDNRMFKTLSDMYTNTLPKMVTTLKDAAEDNGETVRRGSVELGPYGQRAFEVEDFTNGIAYRVGFKEVPQEPQVSPQPANRPPSGNQQIPGNNGQQVPTGQQPQGAPTQEVPTAQ
ncbi:MAG: DUF2723 domain-containing protein [bacterium]|nr:DUF2723 domain-containing protein [bacterium]